MSPSEKTLLLSCVWGFVSAAMGFTIRKQPISWIISTGLVITLGVVGFGITFD